MNISAYAARRKVTGFVIDAISTQMHGNEPMLVTGDLGEVGVIEVDAETGQLAITETVIQGIIHRATELTNRSRG